MAEVDRILLLQLRDIGVELSDGVKSLGDVDPSLFYRAALRCCELIAPESVEGLPQGLPSGMSGRFRACGALAAAVLGTGYGGELSFNQFMYPNPGDVRAVLAWLGQQLPTRQDQRGGDAGGAAAGGAAESLVAELWAALQRAAQCAERRRKERLQRAHTLYPVLKGEYPKPGPLCTVPDAPGLCPFPAPQSEAEAEWCAKHLPYLADQAARRAELIAGCCEFNAAALERERQEDAEFERRGAGAGGLSRKEVRRERKKLLQAAVAASAAGMQRYAAAPPHLLSIARSHDDDLSTVFSDSAAGPGAPSKSRFQKEKEFGAEQAAAAAAAVEPAAAEAAGESAEQRAEQQRQKLAKEGRRIRKELRALETQLSEADAAAAAARAEARNARSAAEAAAERARELDEEGDALERQWQQHRDALEMCGDPASQQLLQGEAAAEQAKLQAMRDEWAQRELKYKGKHDALVAAAEQARAEERAMLEEIEANTARLRELKKQMKQKEALRDQLKHDLELCPKDIDREEFLRRIFDIIRNVHKQQAEIDKICGDTRRARTSIGGLREELDSAFAAAEERCYKEVKQDANEAGRAVYRELISLRESFDALIASVEETGRVKQCIHEYEEKNEKLQTSNDSLCTSQVENDLAQIQQENEQLGAEVKRVRGQLKLLAGEA